MSNNCVMIGDIKKSRHVDKWSDIFRELNNILKKVNSEFSKNILVDFRPTIGDEFQGALTDSKNAYTIYVSIKNKMPVQFYCGVGIGDVEKPLDKDIGMRGSAFYRARSALELCKKRKRNILIKSSDKTSQMDKIINTLLHFIEILENSWTQRQCEVVNYYRLHPQYTYEQLASHFSISKQTVYDILKAANWDVFTETETLIKELLTDFRMEGEALPIEKRKPHL